MTARVGIIVPPKYFDTSAQELLQLSPEIEVMHTQMRFAAGFTYELEEARSAATEIEQCAQSLADAGVDVVLQLGTPFSTAHGWDAGLALQASISDRIGIPLEMMGLSLPLSAQALRVDSVAVASVYYGPEWVARYSDFLVSTGLVVCGSQSFFDQGRFGDQDTIWAKSFDGFDPVDVTASIGQVAESVPAAEAILVPGMPAKLVPHVAEAEAAIGKPIISYYALWWRCLMHLGLTPSAPSGSVLGLAGA